MLALKSFYITIYVVFNGTIYSCRIVTLNTNI